MKYAENLLKDTLRIITEDTGAPETVFDILKARYTQPGRYYHGLDHISHCMKNLVAASLYIENIDAIVLALWFHDSIYTVGAKDNEWRSAELASSLLSSYNVNPHLILRVVKLIMATTHTRLDLDGDAAIIADVDLSSFADRDSMMKNSGNIRKEFESIPDDVYYPGRIKFLQGMLAREAIFQHPVFAHLNAVAKANIQYEIQKLQDHVED